MSTNGRRRPTQADVARMAGVSQTTVSMVVTGSGAASRRVGVEVQKRVRRAIDEIGYTVNPIAQRLVGGKTSIIGVHTYERVFPSQNDDFYAPFLEGIERQAEQAGVDLLLFTSTQRRTSRSLSSAGVNRLGVADACILLGRRTFPEDLSLLLQQNFPFAFVGRRTCADGPIPYAAAGYEEATDAVTGRLLALGHRRVTLLADTLRLESGVDRATGYSLRMEAAGLRPHVIEDPCPDYRALVTRLRADGVTALLALPEVAAGLHNAIVKLGLRIPEDISVARLGEPERPALTEPDWSGFRVPRIEMGEAALRIVLQQLSPTERWDAEKQVTVPCQIVTGSTIGAAE